LPSVQVAHHEPVGATADRVVVPAPAAALLAEEDGDTAVREPVGVVLVTGRGQVQPAVAVQVDEGGRYRRLPEREGPGATDVLAGSVVDEHVYPVLVEVRKRQHEVRPTVAGYVPCGQRLDFILVAAVDDAAPAEPSRRKRARDVRPRRTDGDAGVLGAVVLVVATVVVRDEVGQAIPVEIQGVVGQDDARARARAQGSERAARAVHDDGNPARRRPSDGASPDAERERELPSRSDRRVLAAPASGTQQHRGRAQRNCEAEHAPTLRPVRHEQVTAPSR